MSTDALMFSGVDGATGEYLYDELPLERLGELLGAPPTDAYAKELVQRHRAGQKHFGIAYGHDAERLEQAGWGLVLPAGASPAVREALVPLLERRQSEAGDLYRELTLEPGASKNAFLGGYGMGPGVANPAKVPYYLLLVGGPDAIPYHLQHQLDGQYAVGRLMFDTPQEYRDYAEAVVRAEERRDRRRATLRIFAPARAADRPTALSAAHLATPLASELAEAAAGWDVSAIIGDGATKARLAELLLGVDAPDLLLTVGHGVGFPATDGRRRACQGALVVQDWPGPGAGISEDQYFAAADLPVGGSVGPTIIMAFACFGAGTSAEGGGGAPLVARLPQRLLTAGALAFIGHVDRAMTYSFAWPDAGEQRDHFTSALTALCDGWRVGHAKEYFDERHLDVTVTLNDLLERLRRLENVDPAELARMWTASQDTRNWVVIGDPAVRLPTAGTDEEGP